MSQEAATSPYFDEIDLRPYITILLKFWYLLIIIPGIFFIVAYIYQSNFTTPRYTAISLVTVTTQTLNVNLDSRIQDSNTPLTANRSFPELALSDAVVQNVFDRLQGELPSTITSHFALRSLMVAESGNDLSVIRLLASYEDPQIASLVANTWAEEFVFTVNQVLGSEDQTALVGLEIELEDALQDRVAAETAFIEFRGTDNSQLLSASFSDYQAVLTSSLTRKRDILFKLETLQNLKVQIEEAPETALEENGFALLLFQLDAMQLDREFLEINPATYQSSLSKNEQIETLENIEFILNAQVMRLDDLVAEVTPELQRIQQELAQLDNNRLRIEEEMNLAREVHQSIERQVEEFDVRSEIRGQVRLVSRAAVPISAASSFTPVIAAVLAGFAITFFCLVATAWWWEFNRT